MYIYIYTMYVPAPYLGSMPHPLPKLPTLKSNGSGRH